MPARSPVVLFGLLVASAFAGCAEPEGTADDASSGAGRGPGTGPAGTGGDPPGAARAGGGAGGDAAGPVARMGTPRADHAATLLADGRVLVTGGFLDESHPLRSAEVFDPRTGRFAPAGDMHEGRVDHRAVLMADGRVLVAGGYPRLRSAEIYDPDAATFTRTPPMLDGRHGFTMTVLPDGRVLLIGGGTATAELFDPARGRFEPAGTMAEPRMTHAAAPLGPSSALDWLLPGSKLLVTGGLSTGGRVLRTAEVYDLATMTFLPAQPMAAARHKHAASPLPDGRVLVVGGSDERDWRGMHASTEIYDPRSGEFRAGPDMADPRFKIAGSVALLSSGSVVVTGSTAMVEVFDPGSGRFQVAADRLDAGRFYQTATPLDDGSVLVVGGYDRAIAATDGAWVVRP